MSRKKNFRIKFLFLGIILIFFGVVSVYYVKINLQENTTPTDISPAVSSPGFERNAPPEIKVIDSPTDFEVKSGGYYPGGDILIATATIAKATPKIYLVNDRGETIKAWEVSNKFGGLLGDRRLLPNGNILFVMAFDGIYEITQEGEVVWAVYDEDITHHAEQLSNGNILAAGMGCDCVKEIDYNTKQVVWLWEAVNAFPPYTTQDNYIGIADELNILSLYNSYKVISPVFLQDWTHINYVQWLEDTDTFMISLRNFDLVVEVNRAGEIIWSYGPGVIKQQHYPYVHDDGTILIFDNGNGRVIRVNRLHEIIWEYNGLFIPFLGDNTILPDGNYKILQAVLEGEESRTDLRIVSPDKEILWQMFFDENMYRADLVLN